MWLLTPLATLSLKSAPSFRPLPLARAIGNGSLFLSVITVQSFPLPVNSLPSTLAIPIFEFTLVTAKATLQSWPTILTITCGVQERSERHHRVRKYRPQTYWIRKEILLDFRYFISEEKLSTKYNTRPLKMLGSTVRFHTFFQVYFNFFFSFLSRLSSPRTTRPLSFAPQSSYKD